jgi:hypothetical protein
MRTLFKTMVLLASCLCFTGCIEGPSTDTRSPEISGQVLDSKSQQPLQGVRISLHDHPSIAATSDTSGQFVLRGTKNFHLVTLLGICSTSFPEGKYYHDTLDITNADYAPLQIHAREFLPPDATNSASTHLTLRDISLTPIDR